MATIIFVTAVLALLVAGELWLFTHSRSEVSETVGDWRQRIASGSAEPMTEESARNALLMETESRRWTSALRKITAAAPLLGVVITALLLSLAQYDDTEKALLDRLKTVASGILIGGFGACFSMYLNWKIELHKTQEIAAAFRSCPPGTFATFRQILGTLPSELGEVSASLKRTQQAFASMQKTTATEMERLLTSVRDSLEGLSESAAVAGKSLRESANNHFNQVKVTTGELGKSVGRLDAALEQVSGQLEARLAASTEQVGEVQRSLAQAIANLQSGAEGSFRGLDRQVTKALEQLERTHATLVERQVKEIARAVESLHDRQSAALARRDDAIESGMQRIVERVGEIAGLSRGISELTTHFDQAMKSAERQSESFAKLEVAIGTIGAPMESAAVSTRNFAEQLRHHGDQIGQGLESADRNLENAVNSLVTDSRLTRDRIGALQEAIDRLLSAMPPLTQRVAELAESNRASRGGIFGLGRRA